VSVVVGYQPTFLGAAAVCVAAIATLPLDA